MSKTRRHVGVNLARPHVYTTYRGLTGEQVTIRYLHNTGKDYAPKPWGLAANAFPPEPAMTAQRDIRGHGRNTSRVKRTFRKNVEEIGDILVALEPKPSRPNDYRYWMEKDLSV